MEYVLMHKRHEPILERLMSDACVVLSWALVFLPIEFIVSWGGGGGYVRLAQYWALVLVVMNLKFHGRWDTYCLSQLKVTLSTHFCPVIARTVKVKDLLLVCQIKKKCNSHRLNLIKFSM